MKKSLLVACLLLASCGTTNTNELQSAKDELLGKTPATPETLTQNPAEQEQSAEMDSVAPAIETENITENPIIAFDPISIGQFSDMKEEITGTINGNVDKVTVLFSNPDSSMPNGQPYTLKQFKAGDTTFLYNAFKDYDSLDYGVNTYEVTAYEGEKKHTIKMTVRIDRPETELTNTVTEVDINSLPTAPAYGNPVKIGDGSVTYSDIKGLEIRDVGSVNLTQENQVITDYLVENFDGWFYWNSARKIGENGLSFFVVSQKSADSDYLYQKHYYNGNGLYGVINLETGAMGEEDTLETKNTELATKNGSYGVLTAADALFVDLSK